MLTPAQAPAIEDLYRIYKKRVPRVFHDYCETGSYTTSTFIENTKAFQNYHLRQRVAVNIDNRSTESTMLGEKVAMPVALAPIGSAGMNHADGEILACRAAQKFGVPYTLSTMSVCSIEEVAAHVERPFWFQLYVMRDRDFTRRMIARAKAAKCSALVLTLDLQVLGQRHLDLKNGMSSPPKMTLANIANMMTKPRWALGMLGTKNRTFGNIQGHVAGVVNMEELAEWTNHQFDQTLDWSSIDFIRKEWGGKLILKGINDVEDAKIAAKKGADAIIVSNHGGRQLDGAPATINMLGPIVDAVGKNADVWIDSGIRTGIDVMRALALGAKGTMVGRAYVYGLGAAGEAGVTRALEILRSELDITMALCGERLIKNIGRHNLLDAPAKSR
ncbi:alpha-hydroxy acid oxidase [Aestuariivirga litoralis]|uniref:alpha-hydroxy acid oxidase n=1 Tax=Aestuariivirga litoralis TaxID=2650924 RepID=UPI0018C58FB4|nr:alpha-hydroxy acid oxidase [Aestuariivirga litoralis]MBG1233473.1 alpha-hydroxy-acid oxidizing protein [Aestuariivirga litoralis]